jgi:hypothetical protein
MLISPSTASASTRKKTKWTAPSSTVFVTSSQQIWTKQSGKSSSARPSSASAASPRTSSSFDHRAVCASVSSRTPTRWSLKSDLLHGERDFLTPWCVCVWLTKSNFAQTFIAFSLLANSFFSTYPKRTNKTHPTLKDFNFTHFFKELSK